jgi:hypothetical protein
VSVATSTSLSQAETHVFDVWARVDGDHVTVLHAEVVADDSVYPRGAVVEVVVCQHDENRVLALLALDQDGVAAEELERLHGVVGEGDDGIVIVDGIGDAAQLSVVSLAVHADAARAHMSELGFFFFLRMAVATSSSCGELAALVAEPRGVCLPSCARRPRGPWACQSLQLQGQAGAPQTYLDRSTLGLE